MSSSFRRRLHQGLVTTHPGPSLTPDDYKVVGILAAAIAAGAFIWVLGKAGLLALAVFPVIALRDDDGLLNPSELERRVGRIQEYADDGYHDEAWRLLHELEDELGHPAEMRRYDGEWIFVREYLEDAAGVREYLAEHDRRTPLARSIIIDIH